jgi:hypothetical protein
LKAFEGKLDFLAAWICDHQGKTEANHEELMAMMEASEEIVTSSEGCKP